MDLELIETGNGGDLVKNKDLSVIGGWQNVPYLALFGGNPGYSTPQERNPNEQAFDWWGNTGLEVDQQFNSLTEYTLYNVSLTSSGRSQIEQAVKKDLDFMQGFAEVTVTVIIPSHDNCEINIKVKELNNQQEREFIFIWDSIKRELVPEETATINLTNEVFFFDTFKNNNNAWIPSGNVVGDGLLKMVATNFAVKRNKFSASTPLGIYEMIIEVYAVTASVALTVAIVDNYAGLATTLYSFVPEIPGDITTPGIYKYYANITDINLNSVSDLLFTRNTGGGRTIQFASITINYLG